MVRDVERTTAVVHIVYTSEIIHLDIRVIGEDVWLLKYVVFRSDKRRYHHIDNALCPNSLSQPG